MSTDSTLLIMLRQVVRQQCYIGLLAADDLESAIAGYEEARQRGPEPIFDFDGVSPDELHKHGLDMVRHFSEVEYWTHRIWAAIQALLVAAGNVSKVLFPAPNRRTRNLAPDRGLDLRERLHIADDSVLADRQLRNAFEHFDERIEPWCSDGGGIYHDGMLVETTLGAEQSLETLEERQISGMVYKLSSQPKPQDAMRYFVLDSRSIIHYGVLYETRPLVDAMRHLAGG